VVEPSPLDVRWQGSTTSRTKFGLDILFLSRLHLGQGELISMRSQLQGSQIMLSDMI